MLQLFLFVNIFVFDCFVVLVQFFEGEVGEGGGLGEGAGVLCCAPVCIADLRAAAVRVVLDAHALHLICSLLLPGRHLVRFLGLARGHLLGHVDYGMLRCKLRVKFADEAFEAGDYEQQFH